MAIARMRIQELLSNIALPQCRAIYFHICTNIKAIGLVQTLSYREMKYSTNDTNTKTNITQMPAKPMSGRNSGLGTYRFTLVKLLSLY